MAGTNKLVTENFMRLNFSPKSGITPGTNDISCMSCSQITTRYYIGISGVTSTGNRLPSQNQVAAVLPFYYNQVITNEFSMPRSYPIVSNYRAYIGGDSSGTSFVFGQDWTYPSPWETLRITSFYSTSDGAAKMFKFYTDDVEITSFPMDFNITGLPIGSNAFVFNVKFRDETGTKTGAATAAFPLLGIIGFQIRATDGCWGIEKTAVIRIYGVW